MLYRDSITAAIQKKVVHVAILGFSETDTKALKKLSTRLPLTSSVKSGDL
jgi:hypothetical protein